MTIPEFRDRIDNLLGDALSHALVRGDSRIALEGFRRCIRQASDVQIALLMPYIPFRGNAVSPDVLRFKVTDALDLTLSRYVLSVPERSVLSALRAFTQTLSVDELNKLAAFLPERLGDVMAKTNTPATDPTPASTSNPIPPAVKTRAEQAGLPEGMLQDLWQKYGAVIVEALIALLVSMKPNPMVRTAIPPTGAGCCDHAACCREEMHHLAHAMLICSHHLCCCDEGGDVG